MTVKKIDLIFFKYTFTKRNFVNEQSIMTENRRDNTNNECITIQQLILTNTPLRHEFLKIDKMVCAIYMLITANEDEIKKYRSEDNPEDNPENNPENNDFYELCYDITDIICCMCPDDSDTKLEIQDRVQEFLTTYEL